MRSLRVLSVGLVVLAAGCGSGDESASSSTTSETAEVTTTVAGSRGSAVTTDGATFTPGRLITQVGTTVTFTNAGGSHSVTPDDPAGWQDGGAPVDEWGTSGASYSVSFAAPGEYPYHCSIHGGAGGRGMSGVVVVE